MDSCVLDARGELRVARKQGCDLDAKFQRGGRSGVCTVPATALLSWGRTGTTWGGETSPLRHPDISFDVTPLTTWTCPAPSGHPRSKWQLCEPGPYPGSPAAPRSRTDSTREAPQPAAAAVQAGRRGQEVQRPCALLITHQSSHYVHHITALRASSECREPASVDAPSDMQNAEEK